MTLIQCFNFDLSALKVKGVGGLLANIKGGSCSVLEQRISLFY